MLECPLYNSTTSQFPSLFENVVSIKESRTSLSIGPSNLDMKVCECHLVPFFMHALQLLLIRFYTTKLVLH